MVWRVSCCIVAMEEINETDLIVACKRGDEAAITTLFQRHYASSLRVACRMLRSEEEARDAVQSAYLSAFRNLHSFRGDATFKTWITRIVTNVCLMRLRQSGFRLPWTSLDEVARIPSSGPTPEYFAFSQELALAISVAVARLPKRLCEVFKLYAFSGLSVKEVAAATGLTVPAAKTRLFRAQLRMREHLQPVRSNLRKAAAENKQQRERLTLQDEAA